MVRKSQLFLFAFTLCSLMSLPFARAQDDDEIGSTQHELRGGEVITGYKGVVELSMSYQGVIGTGYCTGSMISDKTILTAAHCLVSPAGTPVTTAAIFYHHPDRGRTNVYQGQVEGFLHPAFDLGGTFNAAKANSDIAVLRVRRPFSNTTRSDYLDLFTGTHEAICPLTEIFGGSLEIPICKRLPFYGAGIHSYSGASDDALRTAEFKIESIKTNHIVVDNTRKKSICKADSGGPLMLLLEDSGSALPLVTSVASGVELFGFESDLCANNDFGIDDAFFSRTNWEKLAGVIAAAGLQCDLAEFAGVEYRRCRDLPIMDEDVRDVLGESQAGGFSTGQ